MTESTSPLQATRQAILSPVDRISETIFGLLMALTFVGAVSAASGRDEIESMFIAALGCNLAWGLVDAVMYLVRTVTDRGRTLALARAVRSAPDAQAGRALVAQSLSKAAAGLVTEAEVEAVRGRIVALPSLPARPRLLGADLGAALAIFVLVVAATFPVVLPFAFMDDVLAAKHLSRVLSLAMLFLAGLGLGRYAGYGSWKVGLMMTALGTVLVIAINALGG
ncbi:hypothetical protein [Variovorax sp. OV329]|uniref:hypothetical protein n=1 Tax=Variovorax sp. OV329 TaxID=1882825 RepID=UPI0008EC37A3|nr:hypothetical protein [Variovorax sp. OV329]SFN51218.1 hypothetical protein SAMN05444747_13213 [Variovorax sp. OV329]